MFLSLFCILAIISIDCRRLGATNGNHNDFVYIGEANLISEDILENEVNKADLKSGLIDVVLQLNSTRPLDSFSSDVCPTRAMDYNNLQQKVTKVAVEYQTIETVLAVTTSIVIPKTISMIYIPMPKMIKSKPKRCKPKCEYQRKCKGCSMPENCCRCIYDDQISYVSVTRTILDESSNDDAFSHTINFTESPKETTLMNTVSQPTTTRQTNTENKNVTTTTQTSTGESQYTAKKTYNDPSYTYAGSKTTSKTTKSLSNSKSNNNINDTLINNPDYKHTIPNQPKIKMSSTSRSSKIDTTSAHHFDKGSSSSPTADSKEKDLINAKIQPTDVKSIESSKTKTYESKSVSDTITTTSSSIKAAFRPPLVNTTAITTTTQFATVVTSTRTNTITASDYVTKTNNHVHTRYTTLTRY